MAVLIWLKSVTGRLRRNTQTISDRNFCGESGKRMKKIDFTECRRIFEKAYNGANGKKIAVEYAGEIYMLKFPPSAENKMTNLSYTNSCFSEHIASSIFRMLGIRTQETQMGTFRVSEKEKIVCACKDFTTNGKILYDFCSIKNTIIDSEHGGTGTELSDITESIDKQQFVNPILLKEFFWDMFVADAFLGNFDRHNGNWGFLYDPGAQKTEIAPVFDCSSCLLPQTRVLQDENELNARIFQFPTSAVKENGRKIRYYDFLMSGQYEECNKALLRIVPRINMEKILEFMEEIPYLSDLQRVFYKTYIQARWEKLILPAYDRVKEKK